MKVRRDRRHGMKLENPLVFYPKFWGSEVRNLLSMSGLTGACAAS
jgi:hypothetical protein